MSTAKEKLQQKIHLINEFEAVEALDFIEYLEQKRFEEIKALEEADEEVKAGSTYKDL